MLKRSPETEHIAGTDAAKHGFVFRLIDLASVVKCRVPEVLLTSRVLMRPAGKERKLAGSTSEPALYFS